MLMQKDQSQFLIIDIQEKLCPVCFEYQEIIRNTLILLQSAQHLGVPVLATEQYPKGLGSTISPILEQFSDATHASIVEKTSFSVAGEPLFLDKLAENRARNQIVVVGMETHICVLQSVSDLMDQGYEVFVVADAVTSRSAGNRDLGLARMKESGAHIVSTESVIFEWLRVAGTPEFKVLSKLIK